MKYLLTITTLFFFACSGKQSNPTEQNSIASSSSIPITSPAQLDMDTLILQDLTNKIMEQHYPNIHSVLIAKDGMLFYEQYFPGDDQNYGKDLGTIPHTDTSLHDLRSITKSVVSALMGIAINQGKIVSVDQKIADFFPEFTFENEKANWTIEHFLTMTTGLAWNEQVPYDNPENDEIRMTYSEDPVAYVLQKPMETQPGTKFNYSGGATQVLAKIIELSSNSTIDKFADEFFFKPLGINHFEWNKYSVWEGADEFVAASGLRLTSRDLLKIGLLYRNQGKWNDQQILDPKWIRESFRQKVEFPSEVADGNDGYGYQFWMWPDLMLGKAIKMVAANGNGGQNIYWDLANDLIVVTTAGNYNKWDIENDTYAILKNHIYPAIGQDGIH